MKIKSKLAYTFILLQIFGITAISSFAILFIRNYLLEEGIRTLEADTEWIAKDVTLNQQESYVDIKEHIRKLEDVSGYSFKLYGTDGQLTYSDSTDTKADKLFYGLQHAVLESKDRRLIYNHPDSSKLFSYLYIDSNPAAFRFTEISIEKDRLYKPIATIRWIIYSGMFISIGIVIFVSIIFANYISKPITQLNNTALEIAGGDVDKEIAIKRSDEFGTLADSINQMASTLKADAVRLTEANKRQRRFFSDITHEVRNPMHALLNSFDMLELNLPEEKKQKVIQTGRSQVMRLKHLFEDLITLAKYDEDPNIVDLQPFDLSELCYHIEEVYKAQAEEKGLHLNLNVKECKVIGDKNKIEQVLDNLVSNAIKYTSEGYVTLSVTVNKEKVKVEVKDTGIGIDEEHSKNVFDRFYRTDTARSRDKGGTGLGLAVVKSIIDAHQSQIELSSNADQGSTFTFTLKKA